MIVLINLFKALFKNLGKVLFSIIKSFTLNLGKGVKIEFPVDFRGNGKAIIGDFCCFGKNSFLDISGFLKLGNGSRIHRKAYLIIEKGAILKTGVNFQLEWDCMMKVQNKEWNIGNNVSISSNCLIYSREKGVEGKLVIGNNSNISNNTIIDVSGDIIIGDNVAIANECNIFTHNHDYRNKDLPSWKGGLIIKGVQIEDGAWIGAKSVILPGVTIGKRAVVAAGSIVTKNVPPNTVFGGNPAKLIKTI